MELTWKFFAVVIVISLLVAAIGGWIGLNWVVQVLIVLLASGILLAQSIGREFLSKGIF